MFCEIKDVRLEKITATVSKNRIPVSERCSHLIDEKTARRYAKATGISSLSIAADDICTSDLCFESAVRIFESGVNKNDIGAIIFISQTPDYFAPATAFILQDRLQLPNNVLAFDISLGCSGFVYGVYVAASMVKNLGKKVLLLCGDTGRKFAYPMETQGLAITGDAGSAAVISVAENSLMLFNIESIGSKWETMKFANGIGRMLRVTDENGNPKCIKENFSSMTGTDVMDFSLYDVPKNINALCDNFAIHKEGIDLFVLHQAQKAIVSTIGARLDVPAEKVPYKVVDIGNVSSASIPVCLSEMKKDREFKSYKKTLLSGFGVGLSIASVLCDFDNIEILPTGEL